MKRRRMQDALSTEGVLRWLFCIQLISMGAMEMSAPFWALHLRSLGLDSPYALAWGSALVYAGPMAMAMLLTPLWGRLGDRSGHKPMLLRALCALAATQLWVATAESPASVLTARLVQGGLAGFIAAAQAYGACLVASDMRGRLMARLQMATAAGSIAGPAIGGLLFDVAGFRSLNLVAGALCFACGVVAWCVLPHRAPVPVSPVKDKPAERAASMLSAAQPPQSLITNALAGLLIAIVLVQSAKLMPQAFFGLYAEQVLHLPAWMIGVSYGATALGLCLAAPLWGKRVDQRSRIQVWRELEWVCWACTVIVMLQALTTDLAVFLAARLLWGLCLAALLPVMMGLLSRDASHEQQGHVIGVGNSAAKAGALLGISVGALALVWLPVQHAFWPVALTYLISAVCLHAFRRKAAASSVPDAGDALATDRSHAP